MSDARPSVTGSPEFDYAEGQPNLFLLMKYKQKLVTEHGLDQAFQAYRQTFHLPGGVRLRQIQVESDREFAVREALYFREIAPPGVTFENQPPAVIGEGNHYPLRGVTRSQFVACIADAHLHGRSSAIQCAGRLLLDFQADEPQRLDDELEWDPVIFHASNQTASVLSGFDEATALEFNEAFTLLGSHTDFFGHWMVEYLPKFVAAMLSGALPQVPVLIDAHMPPSHRESLALLYGTSLHLVEVPAFAAVHVRKLWFAPTLMYMPLHEKRNERFNWETVAAPAARIAQVNAEMRRLATTALGIPADSTRRVFLARKAFRHRKITNAARIEDIARDHGFNVAYPEELDFAGQVDLLRTASMVVAPEGSALFLTCFSPQGARVCVLSHPLTDVLADYNAALASAGVSFCALTGAIQRWNESTPHDSDYEIDPAGFSRFLDRWVIGGE